MVRVVDGSIFGGGGLRLAAVVVASLRREAEESSLAGNVPVAVIEDGVQDGWESELELELGMIVGWEELTWPLVDVFIVLELGILAVESLRILENVPEGLEEKGEDVALLLTQLSTISPSRFSLSLIHFFTPSSPVSPSLPLPLPISLTSLSAALLLSLKAVDTSLGTEISNDPPRRTEETAETTEGSVGGYVCCMYGNVIEEDRNVSRLEMSIDDLLKERKSEDEYPEELSEEEDDEDMVSGKFVANMSAKSDQGGNLLWTRWSDDMVYVFGEAKQ